MPDRFLTAPFRSGSAGYTRQNGQNESRVLRDRMAAHARALDRQTGQPQPYSTARQLVQVYNGGSMGAAADLYYFTHPVLATGAETEGGTAVLTADTATTIPVVVLGHAPSVGDYLTAYAVGGRWVSERGNGSPGGNCYLSGCSPCGIPKANLTLVVDSGAIHYTLTLVYNPVNSTWSYVPDHSFTLSCNASGSGYCLSTIALGAGRCLSNTCPGGASGFVFSSSSCSPFELIFNVLASVDACGQDAAWTFTITGPADPPVCPVCFTVTGCGGQLIPGATVSITGGPSGTTGATGVAILDIGTAGSYTVTVTAAGFEVYSQTVTLACGQAVTINLTTCIPTDRALTATSAYLGITWSLTYLGSLTAGWRGTANYSYPGNGTCSAEVVPITLTIFCQKCGSGQFTASCQLQGGGSGGACFTACPNPLASGLEQTKLGCATVTCSPFGITAVFAAEASNCSVFAPTMWGVLANGNSDTLTVT